MTTCLTLSFLPSQSHAAPTTSSPNVVITKPVDSPEANALVERLHEIELIDRSTLNRKEKRALRQEVRSIEKTLRDDNGGVYISVGGLILIVVLLIILL